MIEIIPLTKIGEDERGSTHIFETDRTGEFIFSFRKAGSLSGRHYHKGLSANKNPEKIILVKGEGTLNWFNVAGEEKGSEKIIGPSLVHIYPGAWHELVADTDIVVFEMNALADGKGDTFRLD
jgi:quercetin dioxygenase-like cupin family protein